MGKLNNKQYKLDHLKGAFMTQKERKRSTRIGRLLIILFTLAALFGLAGVTMAQVDQARITGVVHYQNNAVVPGATITVKNERSGGARTTTSNEDGNFTSLQRH